MKGQRHPARSEQWLLGRRRREVHRETEECRQCIRPHLHVKMNLINDLTTLAKTVNPCYYIYKIIVIC